MAGRLDDYERLLRDLSLRVDNADHVLIQRVLEKVRARVFLFNLRSID